MESGECWVFICSSKITLASTMHVSFLFCVEWNKIYNNTNPHSYLMMKYYFAQHPTSYPPPWLQPERQQASLEKHNISNQFEMKKEKSSSVEFQYRTAMSSRIKWENLMNIKIQSQFFSLLSSLLYISLVKSSNPHPIIHSFRMRPSFCPKKIEKDNEAAHEKLSSSKTWLLLLLVRCVSWRCSTAMLLLKIKC